MTATIPHGPLSLLGLNEIPFPPLPSVAAAVQRAAMELHRYPQFYPDRLVDLIAHHLRIPADAVVVGNGATGVAMQFLHACTRPGERVVYATPTFDGYPIMLGMVGAVGVPVPLDASAVHDLSAMASEVDLDTRAVVVCRPHNPTGTLITDELLDQFIAALPSHVFVVLDEAYVEFVDAASRPDSLHLIERYPNLLVLRTFSKAYGLAALRVGYGFGHPNLIRQLRSQQFPFGMNRLAEPAVRASLRAHTELSDRIHTISRIRDRLRTRLMSLGLDVPASHGNFLWLACGDIATYRQALERHGIQARYYDAGIRLTIGDDQDSARVMAALGALSRHEPVQKTEDE
jgi:histidinol-phosphate aminotransferase